MFSTGVILTRGLRGYSPSPIAINKSSMQVVLRQKTMCILLINNILLINISI